MLQHLTRLQGNSSDDVFRVGTPCGEELCLTEGLQAVVISLYSHGGGAKVELPVWQGGLARRFYTAFFEFHQSPFRSVRADELLRPPHVRFQTHASGCDRRRKAERSLPKC